MFLSRSNPCLLRRNASWFSYAAKSCYLYLIVILVFVFVRRPILYRSSPDSRVHFFWDARCFFWKGSQLQVFSQHLFQDFRQDASFLIILILVFLQETNMAIEFLTPISSFTATILCSYSSPIDSPSFSIFIKADSIIYLDVSLK
jgi:hypothetical protein